MNKYEEALSNIHKHGKTMTWDDAGVIIEALNYQINKEKQNTNSIDDRYDIADSYFRIYGNESLSSHFPEPETDRYP